MKKHILVVTLACLLLGTGAFVQAANVEVGASYVSLAWSGDSTVKVPGYDIAGAYCFSQFPQFAVVVGYSSNTYDGLISSNFSEIKLGGEYRYVQPNYVLAVNAGWNGFKANENETVNLLAIGGNGSYKLMEGLEAVVDVSYSLNSLLKAEEDSNITITGLKAGVEYSFPQVPGLKVGAYYLNKKYNDNDNVLDLTGYAVGAGFVF